MAVICPSTSKPGDQIQFQMPAGIAVTSGLELALEKEDLVRVSNSKVKYKFFGKNDPANARAGTEIPKKLWVYAGEAEFKVTGGSGTQIGVVHVRTENVLKEPCTVQLVSPSGETLMSYEIAGLAEWWKKSIVVPVQLSGQVYAHCTTCIEFKGPRAWESTTRVARLDGSGGLLVAPLDTSWHSSYGTLQFFGIFFFICLFGIIFLFLACVIPVTGRVTSLDGTDEYAPHSEARGIKTLKFVPDPKDDKRSSYKTYDSKAKVDALIGIVMGAVNETLGYSQTPPG